VKLLLHSEHFYGLSSVWTRMCLFRVEDWLNTLPHKWHLYGFSPLWIVLCLTWSLKVVNRLPQTVHSNGFSPEWLRLCTVNACLLWQHFPHSVHLYLLLWTFICDCKECRLLKLFSQWLHEYNSFLVWISWWIVKLSFFVNRLSHTVQKYGLDLSSCGCSVISLRSASIFSSNELSPV